MDNGSLLFCFRCWIVSFRRFRPCFISTSHPIVCSSNWTCTSLSISQVQPGFEVSPNPPSPFILLITFKRDIRYHTKHCRCSISPFCICYQSSSVVTMGNYHISIDMTICSLLSMESAFLFPSIPNTNPMGFTHGVGYPRCSSLSIAS